MNQLSSYFDCMCTGTTTQLSQQQAAALLGYTQASWDNASGDETQPASASKKWADLNTTERLAATVLGYTEQTWSTISESKTPWSALTNTDTSRDEPEAAQIRDGNANTSTAIVAAIAGGVAVVIVIVVIVLVVSCCIAKKKRNNKVAAINDNRATSPESRVVRIKSKAAGKAPTKLNSERVLLTCRRQYLL